jgi:hypothetical protein
MPDPGMDATRLVKPSIPDGLFPVNVNVLRDSAAIWDKEIVAVRCQTDVGARDKGCEKREVG